VIDGISIMAEEFGTSSENEGLFIVICAYDSFCEHVLKK
jgi:hypothetical protein